MDLYLRSFNFPLPDIEYLNEPEDMDGLTRYPDTWRPMLLPWTEKTVTNTILLVAHNIAKKCYRDEDCCRIRSIS